MAEAGPSDTAAVRQRNEQINEAAHQMRLGMQHMRENKLEAAVELFGQVLDTWCRLYGELAEECGAAYFRYGSALFYKAQEDQDVLGGPMQSAARQRDAQGVEDLDESESDSEGKENVEDSEQDAGPAKENEQDVADLDRILCLYSRRQRQYCPPSADAKGKGKAAEDADGPQVPTPNGGEEQQEEGESDDMQLAWEMLEVAKLIFSKDEAKYRLELADTHKLLGDIGAETESFETALLDYDAAIKLLTAESKPEYARRVAEVHFKAAIAQQYLGDLGKALKETQMAIKCFESGLPSKTAAAEPATGDDDQAAAPSNAEVAELEDVLEALYEKLDEIKELQRSDASLKATLKAALSQLGGALELQSGAEGTASPSSAPATTAFGVAASAACKPVVNLGVVGRGNSRITLQLGGPASSAGESKPAVKRLVPERTGFGDAPDIAAFEGRFGGGTDRLSDPVSKKPKPEAASTDAAKSAAPVVPSFLSAASVAATYGKPTSTPSPQQL